MACLAGDICYTQDDCAAEYLITRQEHGFWGGIFNSNVGLWKNDIEIQYGPSLTLNREFWQSHIYKGIFHIGEINADSHESIIAYLVSSSNISCRIGVPLLWCTYETNLLGDPFTFFRDPVPCDLNLGISIISGFSEKLARKTIEAANVNVIKLADQTNVNFIAGKEIRLLPGFNVQRGAEFKAFVDTVVRNPDCE